jgi:hypothetical protein
MASVVAATICILLAASVPPSSSIPAVYNVGDVRGWALPPGNGAETYNHWAKKNRFQVGDVLGKHAVTITFRSNAIDLRFLHA